MESVDWPDVLATAEDPERQWTLLTMLSDHLALTGDEGVELDRVCVPADALGVCWERIRATAN